MYLKNILFELKKSLFLSGNNKDNRKEIPVDAKRKNLNTLITIQEPVCNMSPVITESVDVTSNSIRLIISNKYNILPWKKFFVLFLKVSIHRSCQRPCRFFRKDWQKRSVFSAHLSGGAPYSPTYSLLLAHLIVSGHGVIRNADVPHAIPMNMFLPALLHYR